MVVDVGRGEPVVLIPGLQGRWEWMAPAVDALARRHRVITYSLCDERTSGFPCDPARGFENYVDQVAEALDRAQLRAATLIGVSYGGLIAMEAAARMPARASRLVLASALPADWRPDARARFYLRAPRLLSPLFVISAPARLQPEVAAALPGWGPRLRFMATHGWRVLTAPMSPSRMARRIHWASAHRFADAATTAAPTLVMTGEPGLDRIVPIDVSRRILARIPQARHVVLPRTGHIGLVTRPDLFAEAIRAFIGETGAATRRAS
jgi:pimeloyl-ACP methyl ester carboxylesterase